MAKSKIVNVRINDELQGKLDKLICDMQKELPRGAEVNISSLIRGALEQIIEDYEDEKNLVVTAKLPLGDASLGELKAMEELKVNERAKLMEKSIAYMEGKSVNDVSKIDNDKLKKDLDLIDLMIKKKTEEKGE